jgi:endonuclease YncB( thermonuclease family)
MSGALLVACIVFAVADGDSMKVRCDERVGAISVRLAGIDAPELAHKALQIAEQPGGRESRSSLLALCLGKPSTVHQTATDQYKRMIANVECDGINVNAEQVRRGQAWAYMASKRSKLPALEASARESGVGLWSQPSPIRPSLWRKMGLQLSSNP